MDGKFKVEDLKKFGPVFGFFVGAFVVEVLILALHSVGILNFVVMVVLVLALQVISCGCIFFSMKAIFDRVIEILNGEESKYERSPQFEKILQRDDDIGATMRQVTATLEAFSDTVNGLRKSAEDLSSVSEEFKVDFNDMEDALNEAGAAVESIINNTVAQASHTSDMKDKIDNMSLEIDHIVNNVELLEKGGNELDKSSEEANRNMAELLKMNEKNMDEVENVRIQTTKTNESVESIQAATEIITSIASQTNLLALNASIEAARAGEAGKGFAVVAEEIRQLADQSKGSAEAITEKVNILISNSHSSMEITQTVADSLAKQSEKLAQTKDVYTALVGQINQVSEASTKISEETKGLDKQKEIISDAVGKLSEYAESNSESAELTSQKMGLLGNSVGKCVSSTGKITGVVKELNTYVNKMNNNK